MVLIREETASDFKAVENIIKSAFESIDYSDKTEHLLVNRLRLSDAFVPELSLVAEWDGKLLGHILLTKLEIVQAKNKWASLSLAPVSVLPHFQGEGIGAALILAAHKRAKELGFESIVLLGHADYYPRFGYKMCQDFDLKMPFEAAAENCMVIELKEGALRNVSGMVSYPKAFFE